MADTKISALTAVVTPAGADEFACNQAGTSKKETRTQIVAGVQASLDTHIADSTVHITSAQDTLLNGLTPTLTELNYVAGVTSAIQTQFTAKAALASPTFTGVPAAPNAAVGTSTTQLATTAFVDAEAVAKAGDTMTGALILDDTSLQVQEGVDTLTITVPALTAARAVTFGDLAGQVVLDTATQTLSGKTLTTPTINTPTITAPTVTGIATFTGAVFAGASPLVFEGTTADDFETTIAVTDPTVDRTITIPNDTGTIALTNEQTPFRQFFGVKSIIAQSTGTWTTTRIAAGNYVSRKTAAANVPIIGIDISGPIRTKASSGIKVLGFYVGYGITTDVLNSHTVTLRVTTYANGAAVTVSTPAITGTLATAVNANPYWTYITIDVPAYFNPSTGGMAVVEITADATAGCVYDVYGIITDFSQQYF